MALSASKSMAIQQLLDDLMEFSTESMRWCAEASENATRQILTILDFLTKEAARVSSMSKEAVDAVDAVRMAAAFAVEGKAATNLIAGLKKLAADHSEVQSFIDPIVQTLQFQDRVTQMMDNIVRMIAAWSIERERLAGSATASLDLVAFGTTLLECATMVEERNLIRKVIPGLPSESDTAAVNLF